MKILATLEDHLSDNTDLIVAAQQENLLATVFHPELTDDLFFHDYFVRMVLAHQ